MSRSRISTWYSDRTKSGFPEAHHTEGRKRLWLHDDVKAFFKAREDGREVRKVPASELRADQDELLTAAQVTTLCGWTTPWTIYWYLRNIPGYFPPPDETIDGMRWRRRTVLAWMSSRPGMGRRAGVTRKVEALPSVAPTGDPDELLGAPEVASLLGYGSTLSFLNSVSHGNLPELAQHDQMGPGPSGRPAKKWFRSTVEAAARRRGQIQDSDEELVGSEQAASILGYSSVPSFNGALLRGRLPELDEPDALVKRGGRAHKKWKLSRIKELAAARGNS